MFPSFHIFGWEVGTYGIMVVLGAVACTFVGNNLIKRFGRDIYDFLLILLSIGAGIRSAETERFLFTSLRFASAIRSRLNILS